MRRIWVGLLVATAIGCGGNDGDDGNNGTPGMAACADGVDNDTDGMIDFPDDLGCTSATDTSEDSLTSPQCSDGRDNDDDGVGDYPSDPGCFSPQADDETDDCPTGPYCPQCADGLDNDGSGAIDFPNDPGCTSASDDGEYLQNPVACGAGMTILPVPTTGMVEGTLNGSSTSMIISPCGGGGASAYAYELRLDVPSVVEVSTDNAQTDADTVIDIRSEMCSQASAEIACSDDISTSNSASSVTTPLDAGTYYIIIGGHDSSSAGAFAATIKLYAGEGSTCAMDSQCGPGLVCRTPLGGSMNVCAKPRCADTDDDDGDMKDGYPIDPGCTSLTDNDEADDCPDGPNCPECGDGAENDTDGLIDYPSDPTCQAAGDASESCISSEGVTLIVGAATTGTTAAQTNDVTPTCASSFSHTAPDRTYRLDVPALSSLDLNLTGTTFDSVTVLLNSTCGGTPIACNDSYNMRVANLAAGSYYFVVDGWSTGNGAFTISMNGSVQNGESCEGALFASGALACGNGYACTGTMGARTCQPALCGDGLDNDVPTDGKVDFPFDPGCDSVSDDTEADPATAPVCSDGIDNDTTPDGLVDFPEDYGCTSAAGTSELFCTGEVDPTSLITSATTTGTTAGAANNFPDPVACSSPTDGPDVAFALSLPVPVATLIIDTIGSFVDFDTVLHVRNPSCAIEIACNDDGAGVNQKSKITMTNVAPGNYAIIVDGYGSTTGDAGAYQLNVKGTVAPGTLCDSPMFSGGANAILACPSGSNCMGSPARCQ